MVKSPPVTQLPLGTQQGGGVYCEGSLLCGLGINYTSHTLKQRGSLQFSASSGSPSISASISHRNPFPARPGLHWKTKLDHQELPKHHKYFFWRATSFTTTTQATVCIVVTWLNAQRAKKRTSDYLE